MLTKCSGGTLNTSVSSAQLCWMISKERKLHWSSQDVRQPQRSGLTPSYEGQKCSLQCSRDGETELICFSKDSQDALITQKHFSTATDVQKITHEQGKKERGNSQWRQQQKSLSRVGFASNNSKLQRTVNYFSEPGQAHCVVATDIGDQI